MLPRFFLGNLDTVMAILVLFEQFLMQILFNFFLLNSKFFTKCDAFCYGKIAMISNIVENGW